MATSSSAALAALEAGRTHAAVVHGPDGGLPRAPAGAARFHLTAWRVGLAIPFGIGSSWWSQLLAGELEVVQREEAASVQQTFEQAVGGPGVVSGPRVAGHVVAARHGAAIGRPAVTIEPAARAAETGFHSLDRHVVELWVDGRWLTDRGVENLLDLLGSSGFRRRLETVGGYELDEIGRRVA